MEIQNYPKYLIYQDGKVQNKKTEKFLKGIDNGRGYLHVSLYHEGKYQTRRIHILLALQFIPNPENKPHVDHIDRNNKNNDISNLRWVTPSENNQNKGKFSTNTSGHKNISYHKRRKLWVYEKMIRGHRVYRRFKTKTEALCFKYIQLLRIKANHQRNIRV